MQPRGLHMAARCRVHPMVLMQGRRGFQKLESSDHGMACNMDHRKPGETQANLRKDDAELRDRRIGQGGFRICTDTGDKGGVKGRGNTNKHA